MESGISSIYAENLKYVNGLQLVEGDDYSLIITLSQAVPFFEYNLTFPILSEEFYFDENFVDTDKNQIPVGTGMFKIESNDSNVIKLIKNEEYWNSAKNPMIEEIAIHLYKSMGEVYNAFKSGEIDILTVKTNNVEDYIGTLGYNKLEYKSRKYDFLAFNTLEGIYSDPAVRKAVSLIIDKNAIIAKYLGTGFVVSNFSLDMGEWLYIRDLNVEQNLEEAFKILQEAGWVFKSNAWLKDRTRLALNISVNGEDEKKCEVAEEIAEQLRNVGITTTVNRISKDKYLDMLKNKNFECVLTGIEASFSPSLNTFFGENNLANYNNQEMLELINKTENTNDEGVMYDSYREIYDKYLEEAPYIGLYRNTDIVIYNQGLVGQISPNRFNLYHNIEKWYRQ